MSTQLIGVMLGVGATLIGIVATLIGIAIQLRFNARQRERERQMQLRRDVYLEAAEGIAGSVEYLMQHSRTDVPLGAVPAPKERPGWLYKIHLVASTDTLIAFNDAGAATAAAALDVFGHRVAVAEVSDDIAIVRATSERIQRFQEEMKAEPRAIDKSVPSERTLNRLEWIQQQLDESWRQLEAETSKLDNLTREHARRSKVLVQRSMQLLGGVHKEVRAALLSARAELEMPVDVVKFQTAAASLDARMTAKVDEFLQLIREEESSPAPLKEQQTLKPQD